MRRMSTIFVLAASAILLASCADPQPQAGIPAELRELINANREIALPPPHPDFEALLDNFLTPDFFDFHTTARIMNASRQPTTVPGYRIRSINRRYHLAAFLSHDELAQEIYFLFDLLRHAYAGYQYFGGDAVFLPLRDSMLEQLAGMSDPLQVSAYLQQILAPGFRAAIGDNHFQIHDITFSPPNYVPHIGVDFVLRRSDYGFVTEIDGAAHRVLETALRCGTPVDGVLPTLTAEGEFAFAFGRLASAVDRDAVEMTVLFECVATGATHSRSVNLTQFANYRAATHPVLATREVGGITVVENRGFSHAHFNHVQLRNNFAQAGREARDLPVLVLDIRRHRGGYSGPGQTWIRGFTGQPPRLASAFAAFYRVSRLEDLQPVRTMRRMPGFAPPGWRGSLPNADHLRAPIANDNFLIVLMDKGTSSGGDRFVGYLRQLENVLFVGANTHGNLVTGGVRRKMLPRSGLDIIFGTELHLRPDFSRFEGVGFLPDLWVPPGEALDRVLAFIERYGLNSAR